MRRFLPSASRPAARAATSSRSTTRAPSRTSRSPIKTSSCFRSTRRSPATAKSKPICFDASPDGRMAATGAQLPDGTACKAAPDLCHTDGVCKGGRVHGAGHARRRLQLENRRRHRAMLRRHTRELDEQRELRRMRHQVQRAERRELLGARRSTTSAAVASRRRDCWSHCCSLSFSPSCAASDCNGNCSSEVLPAGHALRERQRHEQRLLQLLTRAVSPRTTRAEDAVDEHAYRPREPFFAGARDDLVTPAWTCG